MAQLSSARLVNGFLYSIKPWPKQIAKPTAQTRWAIYRDGQFVGATTTKYEAWQNIYTGRYDPRRRRCVSPTSPAIPASGSKST